MSKLTQSLIFIQTLTIGVLLVHLLDTKNSIEKLQDSLIVKASYSNSDQEYSSMYGNLNQLPTIKCSNQNLELSVEDIKHQLAVLLKSQSNSFEIVSSHNSEDFLEAYSLIEAQVNALISQGSVSDEEFYLIAQEAAKLPKTERDKLLSKLARELNQLSPN